VGPKKKLNVLEMDPTFVQKISFIPWIKNNLFSNLTNSILTFFGIFLLYLSLFPFIEWAIINADFTGTTGKECTSSGACWAWVDQRINHFFYGFYPPDEYWRVNLTVILLIPAIAYILFDRLPFAKPGKWFSVTYPFLASFLLLGGLGLEGVTTDRFGGFMLNLVAGLSGIILSLPLGILLALGRRSKLPLVRWLSIGFIEVLRGVPLITLLFVAVIILQLFLPPEVSIDKLFRVMIMITFFASAYMAEVVRGGLQAISQGQYESAEAMGLKYWQSMRLIILPQALKISIPGIVNTFIGLFKDTTLVIIIGLFDILGQARLLQSNPDWMGKVAYETFFLVAVLFFVICFSMSRYSIRLEKRLNTDQ
jgi:general L-amino acid transport system permease protein